MFRQAIIVLPLLGDDETRVRTATTGIALILSSEALFTPNSRPPSMSADDGTTTRSSYKAPTSFDALLSEPKGKTVYFAGEAFMLHVFWETPSREAATELLRGLSCCAAATHRNTPCVPVYFFRLSSCDDDLCPPPPTTVGNFPALMDASRKLSIGIPAPAVHAELKKKGVDVALLSLPTDAPLPPELLNRQACIIELTEVYLDERAFVEHAGSRDYLDGHAAVMSPALQSIRRPRSLQLGTPNAGLVERILEPVLQATEVPLGGGNCFVWRPLPSPSPNKEEKGGGGSMFLSLDTEWLPPDRASAALPSAFVELCCTLTVFEHPLRDGATRVMAVLYELPTAALLEEVDRALLHVARGQAHVLDAERAASLPQLFEAAGLHGRVILNTNSAGYVLHSKAAHLTT